MVSCKLETMVDIGVYCQGCDLVIMACVPKPHGNQKLFQCPKCKRWSAKWNYVNTPRTPQTLGMETLQNVVEELSRRVLRMEERALFLKEKEEKGTADEPRPLTQDEMAKKLIDHIRFTARYWGRVELDEATQEYMRSRGLTRGEYRTEAFAEDILKMIDGEAEGIPPILLRPDPYNTREDDENWWSGDAWINENMSLFELWKELMRES